MDFWRMYEIHRLISQQAYPNCPSLAEHLGISTRTAERDIERLRDLFKAPIEYNPARRGYHYTGPFDLPPIRLREGEAIETFIGPRLLTQYKGTSFEEFASQAMTKMRMFLRQSVEVTGRRVVVSRSEPRKVVIEFDREEAPHVKEQRWHKNQVLEELPDGQLRMTLRTGEPDEIMRWVMSLGSHAWVIEPKDFRVRIEMELEAASAKYRAKDTGARPAQLALFE